MPLSEPPHFCPRCGTAFAAAMPPAACGQCGWTWYRDPKVGAGVVVTDAEDRILLVRRNHEPRMGLWAFPSGFVDAGEIVEDAAVREVREETGVEVHLDALLGVYSEAGEQVIFVAYAGTIVAGTPRAGDEAIEVGLFAADALPPLAFDHDDQIMAAWHTWRAQRGVTADPPIAAPAADKPPGVGETTARVGGMLGRLARRVAENAIPEAERVVQRARAAAEAAKPHLERAAQQAGRQAADFAKSHEDEIRGVAEVGARVAADRIVPAALRPVVNAAEERLRRDAASEAPAAAPDAAEPENDAPEAKREP